MFFAVSTSKWFVAMLVASSDLGRELVLAAGVEVAEPDEQARRPRQCPLQPALGQRNRDVDALEPGVLDQEVGGVLDLVAHGRGDDRGTQIDRHSDAPAAHVLVAQPGFPAADAGEREGVVLVGAVAHVEPARRVAHRARDAPEDRGERLDLGVWPFGDPPERRLQPEQAGEAGRDADGAAAVAAGAEREEAAGD